MSRAIFWRGRILSSALLVVAVSILPAHAGPPGAVALESRVRELHAKSSEVKVTLLDKTVLRGRILRVEPDSFTIQQVKTGRQTAIQYSQAKDVRKSGLSRRAKAILIPAVVGGGVLLVLCAAPYPIGFLCRKDPS